MKKALIVGIIVLFICVSVIPSSGTINENSKSRIIINNGSLLGYVNDTSGNPIEEALVRVYFHETYEEDYSDSTGCYHVTNIPICYCLKNATCSKEGYKTEWVLLSIVENRYTDSGARQGKEFVWQKRWWDSRGFLELYYRTPAATLAAVGLELRDRNIVCLSYALSRIDKTPMLL